MIKLDRLKSQLHTSGLQHKDLPLFQIISSLIDALRQFVIEVTGTPTESGSGGGIGLLASKTYITETDESSDLPNSRQLLAGSNISFDDTVSNQRTINVTSVAQEWSVATNGNLVYPELIFVGGDVIMLHTP